MGSLTIALITEIMKRSRKPLSKRSDRAKQKIEAKKELLEIDRQFYLGIWLARPHFCNFCKCHLGNEPRTYHFDHILEKEVFPEYRHTPKNIQLLCLNCHNNKTSGYTPEWFKNFVNQTKQICQGTITEIPLQENTQKDQLSTLEEL